MTDLFQKLVDKDPSLAGLLSSRDPSIKLPASGGSKNVGNESGTRDEFEGKYSPSFVRLEEKVREGILEVPAGRSRPFGARTDAANDYLQRTDNPGKVILDQEVRKRFGVREHLKDGRLTFYFTPNAEAIAIGDTLTFKLGLKDDAMAAAVESEQITVKVVEDTEDETKEKKTKTKNANSSGGDQKSGKGEDAPTHGLPKYVLMTQDGRDIGDIKTEEWPDGFSETDGGTIEDLGTESIFKINYDNVYHLKYKKAATGIGKDVVSEKYILGMRILLLGTEHALKAMQKTDDGAAEFLDEFRRAAARGAASTVLALAENLPKIVDASSVQTDNVE